MAVEGVWVGGRIVEKHGSRYKGAQFPRGSGTAASVVSFKGPSGKKMEGVEVGGVERGW